MKNVKAYFQYLLFVDRRQPVITLGDRDYTGSDALLDERIKTRRQLYAFRLFYLVVVVSLMIYVFHLSSFAAILSLIPAELIFLVFKMPADFLDQLVPADAADSAQTSTPKLNCSCILNLNYYWRTKF